MSYTNGMAAINLEMTDTVPRTEYSAASHWKLVNAVTGSNVTSGDDPETQLAASRAFVKAWDYGMVWSILTYNEIFGEKLTKMGHATYAADGVDYCNEVSSLFEDPEDVFAYDMFEQYGKHDKSELTEQYNAHYAAQQQKWTDSVPMTGVYVTCMSGLIELLGWDTLLSAAGIDNAAFGQFVNRYCDWILQYFEALAECKSPVVMVHDDIVWGTGAFLHPDFYREFIFPNYMRLFAPLHDTGKKILFTSDGNYTEFIDDIVKCGVNGFVMEPSTDMAYMAAKYGKTHVFVGNVDTNFLLRGSKEDIEAEVRRCMDIGRKYPGFMLAVGNHIPSNTPVDNALYYDETYRKLSKR